MMNPGGNTGVFLLASPHKSEVIMQSIRTVFLLLLFALTTPALAGGDIKLGGTAALDEESCSKGVASPDCRIDFSITGKAAKQIYDGMTSKGAMQECTGNVEKFDDSGMHCIKGKNVDGYLCDFSYAFKKQTFGAGPDGC
jgi:hypothetical protein